nr:2-(S)-hydroxypropyl-CoM dehydrogenase 3-like [Nerophis lumbriciformis]
MKLPNQVALVTGGASGIGRALALELAKAGARVLLADLDLAGAEHTAEVIRRDGGQVECYRLDVTDGAAFAALVTEAIERHGQIDLLFNNAGVGVTGEVRDMTSQAWDRVIDVNLRGVIHGIQAVYPQMIRQGHGHILNTACVAGLVPFPMTAAYCATKHAVVGLSAALRAEAGPLGVRVSVICPGTVDTAMFDRIEYLRVNKEAMVGGLGPVLMPADRCARAILRGMSRNRSIILITGHARLVWWLYRLLPRTFLAVSAAAFQRLRKRLRDAPQKP